MIGAEAVRTSGYHSNFVVEALDRAAGNLAFGPEPVQQQLLMAPQHSGNFLHGRQTAAHGAEAPAVQESSCPRERAVVPKVSKRLFQLPSPGSRQFAG